MGVIFFFFFFQAEDGIRDVERSRGLGDVYKRQVSTQSTWGTIMMEEQQSSSGKLQAKAQYYSIVSIAFLIAFGIILFAFDEGEAKECQGGARTVGNMIFYSLIAEFVIGALNMILRKMSSESICALKIMGNIQFLWMLYVLGLFIYAQIVIYDSDNNCSGSILG
eukprot:TRINITY_DN1297_c0_g1_i1.p1 TRINITY_DN1297_c0_g1~~TRINITY_DN1297_c0_g1_i1.p1  ORF type:complete len:165 (-),score=43.64 TRINITY_DN1297_c0_g1_i1:102-596(-)